MAVTLAAASGATLAYFTDYKVLGNNTFSTGSVKIGEISPNSLTLTDLKPGVKVTRTMTVNYAGTLDGDVYIGVGGSSPTTADQYFADHLALVIKDGDTPIFTGHANYLSTHWQQIMNDVVSPTSKALTLEFTLDEDIPNNHQNQTNTDTVFLIYALQKEAPAPTSLPHQEYSSGNMHL